MYTINLKNSSFPINKETTITKGALEQGIYLPHSCLSGRCNACKVRVLDGQTRATSPELSLSEHEMANGEILACCRIPLSNLSLDVSANLEQKVHATKILPTRIFEIATLSQNTLRVILRIPPTELFSFNPGQYIKILRENGLSRSYSISNAKRVDQKIELIIGRVENGLFSEYWFNEAAEGDLLRLEGPYGSFWLDDSTFDQLNFIATGTGIAPVKSIIEDLILSKKISDYDEINIIWGNRTREDVFWRPSHAEKNIKFCPIYSRETEDALCLGYVSDYIQDFTRMSSRSLFYLCGSAEMVDEVSHILTKNLVPQNSIVHDTFLQTT